MSEGFVCARCLEPYLAGHMCVGPTRRELEQAVIRAAKKVSELPSAVVDSGLHDKLREAIATYEAVK